MVNFVEINAGHFHAQGTVGEYVHRDGKDDLLFCKDVHLFDYVFVLVVGDEEILGLWDDGDYFLQLNYCVLVSVVLVDEVDVHDVDGQFYFCLFHG